MKKANTQRVRRVLQGGRLLTVSSIMVILHHFPATAQEVAPGQMLQPPSLALTDQNHVNIASGEVSITLEDVSIGQGALSLSHTISTHSSDFVNYENTWGPADRFHGGLKKKHLYPKGLPGFTDDVFVATYFDFEGSLDFTINGDGTFSPLHDPAYSLTFENGLYTVRKKDGTLVEIPGTLNLLESTTQYTQSAGYTKITYPNGFTINVVRQSDSIGAPIDSVYTNTGLQLKYVYDVGYRHLPADTNNEYNDVAWPTTNMADDGLEWSARTPASVVAINRGYEYCVDSGACNLQQAWPVATYSWPAGMPKAAFVKDSVFSVTDSAGRVTQYHHTTYDIDKGDYFGGNGSPENRWVTRLNRVQFAGQTAASISYTYSNVFDPSPLPAWTFYRKNIGPATLSGATNKGRPTSYSVGPNGVQVGTAAITWEHKSAGPKSVESYVVDTYFHVPVKAHLWDKNVTWYHHGQTGTFGGQNDNWVPASPVINRIQKVQDKRTGLATEYEYDGRGNVTKVYGTNVSEAGYPVNCIHEGSSANTRYCNKPAWTKDNRGHQTDFTWHRHSGQIEMVTHPADDNGHRARIRYGYSPKYAWYKDSSGSIVKAATSVWVLTSEKTCRTGNTNSTNTGCEDEGVEIVTTYHYGTEDGSKANNLWLTGFTVTADGQSRTTCYTYDRFGNRLSETAPKANLTTCP